MEDATETAKGTEAMATEYHDDFNTRDDIAFWAKGTVPRFFLPVSRSRWSVLVLLCVFFVLLLGLIISVTVTNRRFSSVENTVTDLSSVFQQSQASVENTVADLSSVFQQSQASAAEAKKVIDRLRLSVAATKQQLDSVTESLKDMDEVKSLHLKMDKLRCAVERILNNGTTEGCCPLGWELYSSRCYWFSSTRRSWNHARTDCIKHNAELVVMNTKEEWSYLAQKANPVYYWVGLSDERTGNWEWLNGTPYVMDRSQWMPNQPDNWRGHGLGGTEDCAHLHTNGRLNDLHCTELQRYICKAAA